MFSVEILPAQRGDALWLTYGPKARPRHVIIDAGPSETITSLVPQLEDRIRGLPGRENCVELLIVSHVDADHIQGVVSLLSEPSRVRLFRDVWFNGYEHLKPEKLGGPEGEMLTRALKAAPERWNRAFHSKAVVVPPQGPPPKLSLPGGLELVLLAPSPAALAKLAPKWARECEKAGLMPGHGAEVPRAWQRDEILGFNIDLLATKKYSPDYAKPNGSSIVVLARYEGKSVLCTADAPSEAVEAGLDRLGVDQLKVSAVKLSHHGSHANTSPALLQRLRSKNWLISSNGAKFKHPHPETLARVIASQDHPTFHLNYVTPHVRDLIAHAGDGYEVKTPKQRRDGSYEEGIVVRL